MLFFHPVTSNRSKICESIFGCNTVYTKYMVTSGNHSDLCLGGVHLSLPSILLVFLSVLGSYHNFLGTCCLHLQGLNDFCSEDGDRMLVPPTRLHTRRQRDVYMMVLYLSCVWKGGAHGGTVVWGTVLEARRSQVRFPMVSFEFFIDIILLATL